MRVPLVCDCRLKWYRNFIESVMFPVIQKKYPKYAVAFKHIKCKEPLHLKDEKLFDVAQEEFVCTNGDVATYCYHKPPPRQTTTNLTGQ